MLSIHRACEILFIIIKKHCIADDFHATQGKVDLQEGVAILISVLQNLLHISNEDERA